MKYGHVMLCIQHSAFSEVGNVSPLVVSSSTLHSSCSPVSGVWSSHSRAAPTNTCDDLKHVLYDKFVILIGTVCLMTSIDAFNMFCFWTSLRLSIQKFN